jgi:hypothetical protein
MPLTEIAVRKARPAQRRRAYSTAAACISKWPERRQMVAAQVPLRRKGKAPLSGRLSRGLAQASALEAR